MAVLRALVLEPAPIVAHEIPEPARARIPGMLDERGKARRQRIGQARLALAAERA